MFGTFGVTEEKIAKWGEKRKAAKLVKAAMSRKPNIRLAAVKAMGNVDDEQVFNLLITCLRDRSPEVKKSCYGFIEEAEQQKRSGTCQEPG